ncbi:MAG TPA: 4-alpha-glucanotransferase, partial [Kiloniellales bacterium]|nr:4-alpha-glucanotransferase [Kiloniellales bacterium]
MTEGSALDQLADLVGIQSDYLDAWGTRRQVPEETKRRILAALGFPVEDPAALKQDVEARLGNRRDHLVPPVLVLRDPERSRSLAFASAKSHRRALHWQLNCEDGRIHRGRAAAAESGPADKNWIAIELPPDLPTGYHDLEIRTAEGRSLGTSRLIVAPARCWRPAELEGDGRLWGISAQLYSVRSARNWGLGDLTDLAALFRGAARCGAGAVGINPLHALFPERPDHASPYSPSSRLFLNPLYLDVEAIEDYRDSALARRLVDSPAFRNKLAAARRAERIDYRAVAALKLEVLEILYQSFRERCLENPEHPRTADFRDFCGAGGDSLRLYCLFHALLEHFRAQGSDGSWRSWPPDYRDPRSPVVARFAAEHEERIEFQAYLQWQTDLQLRRAGGTAHRLGLPVGLYGDLAVGADPGGAEAWADQDLFVPDVSVGAPPDPWNLKGQTWGSPPMNPEKLANAAYQPFVEVLRANMRHAGALRIDHVLGLMRLFWIPAGLGPDSGAYVRYPWRDLIAIVALESVRNRCLVVGEDLGTLPEGLREALAEAGILSYRLLYFEKDSENRFRPPDAYEREAVVSVTTHDLPTIAGYWHGRDLRLRSRLDLWPSDEMRRDEQRNRARDKSALISALAEEDLAHDGAVPEAPPTDEIHAFLARTPSRLLLVQLEDILGSLEQMNLPGTVDEHPNWRRKLSRDLATTLNHPALTRLARRIGAIRGARPWPGWDPDPVADEARRAPPDVPAATYRVQLSRDVTFDDAARLVTYLARLGVTHLYASP